MLCCARDSTTTCALVQPTDVLLLLYTGAAVPPATVAHKESWIGMTGRCSKVDGPTFWCKQAIGKCQELHAPGKQTERSMHVRTCFFDTYSDRHVLGLLLFSGGIGLLCRAVLCCTRGPTTYIHSRTQYDCCIKRSRTHMLALANSVCLLALSSGIYERESTAKHGTAHHGTAWHSSAHHGTARHRTARYGTARHHTHGTTPHGIARRCAAPLSYLS